MARGVKVTDRDRGWRKLMKRVSRMVRGRAVSVGVLGESGSNVDVASIHEFGLGDHPERSFIRAWVDQDRTELERDERNIVLAVVRNRLEPDVALEQLGILLAAKAQKFIADGRVQPPTDKNGTTLIADGQLRSSISHKVE